jgi:hypothetical protein
LLRDSNTVLSRSLSTFYRPRMGINPTTRELDCPIAAKPIRAVLRRGGLLGGPATTHVRCSELSCQYVDSNEPPCPLRLEIFEVPSDRLVADRVTTQVEPMCMECIASVLRLSHDEVRRGLWPLTDRALVRVRPGRCRTCGRRRVVVHSTRPRGVGGARTAVGPVEPMAMLAAHHANGAAGTTERRAATQRVLSRLVESAGDACCPACLALGAGASLDEVRQVLGPSGPLRHFVVGGGECSMCGRGQAVLAALPAESRGVKPATVPVSGDPGSAA